MSQAAIDYEALAEQARTTTPAPAATAADPASAAPPFNGPRLVAPPDDRPVTLGDLRDDPVAAIQRIGSILKKDVSDPKLWVSLAAGYFAPKVFSAAAPIVARAAGAAKSGAGAVLSSPAAADAIGMVSPRMANAARTVQRLAARGDPAPGGGTATPSAPAAPPTAAPVPEAAVPSLRHPMPGESIQDFWRRRGGQFADRPAAAPAAPSTPTAAPAPTLPPPASRSASAAPVAPLAKLKLTAEEFQAAEQLVKEGYAPEDVKTAILRNRLPEAWKNLPSDREVWADVEHRNRTGKW